MARENGSAPNVRWHLRKDGKRVFIEGSLVALRNKAGELRGFQKIGQDVTKRRLAEAALRESEERLRGFGEASQDVLWIRDVESLQWIYLTPAFEMIYGVSREEALAGDKPISARLFCMSPCLATPMRTRPRSSVAPSARSRAA